MESAVRYSFDALLAMQDIGSAAIVATAAGVSASNPNGGPLDMYKLTDAGPRPLGDLRGRFGLGEFDVVVHVGAIDQTSGNETYALHFQTAATPSASDTWTDQQVVTVTSAMVGETVAFGFHPETLKAIDPNAAFLRVYAVLAGTTPSMQYHAFASENSHA